MNKSLQALSECTLSETALLSSTLGIAPRGQTVIEVGTAAGGTLAQLINYSNETGRNDEFIVIDTMKYVSNQFETVIENLNKSGVRTDKLNIWPGTTSEFLKNTVIRSEFQIALLFIDAEHKPRPLYKDLMLTKYLMKGGYICIHDYGGKFTGVTWLINRMLRLNKKSLKIFGKIDNLIIIEKVSTARIKGFEKIDWLIVFFAQPILRVKKSIIKRLKDENFSNL